MKERPYGKRPSGLFIRVFGETLLAEELLQQAATDFLNHVLLESLAEAGKAILLAGRCVAVLFAKMADQSRQLTDEVTRMTLTALEDVCYLLEACRPFTSLCIAILGGILHLADQPVNQLEGLLRRVAELRVALLDLFDIHGILTFCGSVASIGSQEAGPMVNNLPKTASLFIEEMWEERTEAFIPAKASCGSGKMLPFRAHGSFFVFP